VVLSLRAATREDLAAITNLVIACDVAEIGQPDFAEDDVRSIWDLPRFDFDHCHWVLEHGSACVGYAFVWDSGPAVDFVADVWVDPRSGDSDAFRLLLDRAERYARVAERLPSATIRVSVAAGSPSKRATLESAGFEIVNTELRMAIDLRATDPVEPRWPAELNVQPYRAGIDDSMIHEVIEETFADHFGFTTRPLDEWLVATTGHGFDPDLWFLVFSGEMHVAALLGYDVGDIGFVGKLGVRREWRRRGIGEAMLHHVFDLFRRRDRFEVHLGVDTDNVDGAARLYERVGMHEMQRSDGFRKPL